MTKIRDELSKLLREQIFRDLEYEDGVEFLRVSEPQNLGNQKGKTGSKKQRNVTGKLNELKLIDMPDNFAAIILDHNNLDEKPKLTINENFSWLIVDNHSGISDYSSAGRKCDIVIVVLQNDIYHVLVIELKSKKFDYEILHNKFINSYYILEYLANLMGEYHCGRKIFPIYRFILLTNSNKETEFLPKSSTYREKGQKRDPFSNLPAPCVTIRVCNDKTKSFEEIFDIAFKTDF